MEWNTRDYINLIMFIVVIGGGLISFGGLIHSLRSVVKSVEKLETDVEQVNQKLVDHKGDKEAHVNHLYIGTLARRIDSLEAEVKDGNKEINKKLDNIVEKLYERKKHI